MIKTNQSETKEKEIEKQVYITAGKKKSPVFLLSIHPSLLEKVTDKFMDEGYKLSKCTANYFYLNSGRYNPFSDEKNICLIFREEDDTTAISTIDFHFNKINF